MDKPVEVAVVGAGLGGLALAAGLHSRGIHAHVFEKSSSLAADTATAISLSRNASRALDGICDGLSASIKAVASITRSTKLTMSGGGNDQTFLTSCGGDGGDELYVIKWRSARSILASLVPDSYIHCSHTLLDYTLEEDHSVALRFQLGGGEIATIRARFVVGADGINSAVRRWINPSGDDPRDLHLINWNALVYNPGRFSVHDRDQIAMIRDGPSLCYLVDAGEDYTMWVFRVEDRSTGLGSSGGFSDESVKARVLREIDKLIESSSPVWKSLRIAVEATEAGAIFQRRIKDRIPLKSWSDLDHRVLLIGDAAHAMHWGPGQGARTAFEDAHQLCDLLSPGLEAGSREQTKQAVIRFQELRIPRLTKFQGFAAETTSIPEFVPDWVKKLTPIERRSRMKEFQRWADSYPENMTGDPNSVYFK